VVGPVFGRGQPYPQAGWRLEPIGAKTSPAYKAREDPLREKEDRRIADHARRQRPVAK
jgi:hypothetical protein